MQKAKFDEMQEQKKNRIGNQSFWLLTVLLMIYTVADNIGFKWADFSSGVFIIIIFCCGIYSLRSILAGAFAAPNKSSASAWIAALGSIIVAVACAILLALYFRPAPAKATEDSGALIMAVVSGGFLAAGGVAYLVKRRRENKKDE